MTLTPILSSLYQYVVVGKEKAVAGAAVAFGAAFVAQHLGYHVSNGLQQTLVAAGIALLSHLTVYLTQNRK